MARPRSVPAPSSSQVFRAGQLTPFLEGDFSMGMVQDLPRTMIPEGGAYRLRDYLCDQPGKVYKRGGTVFASPAVPQDLINICAVCEFPGNQRLVMIGSKPGVQTMYDVTTGAAGVSCRVLPFENPPFWVHDATGSLILTHGNGGQTPQRVYLSGNTAVVGDLPGAPAAKCSCVHLDRLVLANSNEYPNRLWFSEINDPLNWSAANNFKDTSGEVIGMASIQGALLVFHRGSIQRILGDIPPGYGNEEFGVPPNMELQPVSSNVGCFDARTIVQARGSVWFASEYGIYATNGGAPVSLTTKDDASGVGQLWRSITFDLNPGVGAVMAQGIYADTWLFSSVRHPAGMDFQTICYLPTGSFVTTSINIACVNYATRTAPHAGIYGCNGNYSEPIRLLDLTPLFVPYPGPQLDADGQPVLPILETRMIGQGPSLKSYHDAYVTYDIRGGQMQVEVGTNVEGSNYKVVPESPLRPTSSEAARRRFSVSKDSNAVQFRLSQLTPSERTEVYMIEAAYHDYFASDGRFP